jgi:hypothetical protein
MTDLRRANQPDERRINISDPVELQGLLTEHYRLAAAFADLPPDLRSLGELVALLASGAHYLSLCATRECPLEGHTLHVAIGLQGWLKRAGEKGIRDSLGVWVAWCRSESSGSSRRLKDITAVVAISTAKRALVTFGSAFLDGPCRWDEDLVGRSTDILSQDDADHVERFAYAYRPTRQRQGVLRATARVQAAFFHAAPIPFPGELIRQAREELEGITFQVATEKRIPQEEGPRLLATEKSADTPTLVLPFVATAAEIAKLLGRDPDAVATFLQRHRRSHPDCVIENDNRRNREHRYLYRCAEVWPALVEHFGDRP